MEHDEDAEHDPTGEGPGGEIDPGDWQVEADLDDDTKQWTYTATGPCPGCFFTLTRSRSRLTGPVEGVLEYAERLPAPGPEHAPREVEIPFECGCNAQHGRTDGGTGCGRKWSITIEVGS